MSLQSVKRYDAPEDVISDRSLDTNEKIEFLKSWACDLENRLTAAEENMGTEKTVDTSKDADLLQAVNEALLKLTGAH